MTSPNGLGKRTTSAAVSAALVLSLCPMAPIQSAIAETTDEAGSVESANPSGGGISGAELTNEPQVGATEGEREPASTAQVFEPTTDAEGSLAVAFSVDEDGDAETWISWGEACEYKKDSAGNVVLRPKDGAASAKVESLGSWSNVNPTSFKIEGTIKVAGTSEYPGLDYAFSGCSNLVSVDLSGLVIDDPVGASGMFSGCSSLVSVTLPGAFKVSSAYDMFSGCSSLEYLDLSGLDTSSAAGLYSMFDGCDSLSSVTLGEDFSFSGSGEDRQAGLPDGYWISSADNRLYASGEIPSNVAATYYICSASEGWTSFGSCEYQVDDAGGVTLRPLGGADYAELDSLGHFGYNIEIGKSYWTAINPTSFKVEGGVSVTSADYYGGLYEAFVGCSELQTVDLSGLCTSEPVSCSYMFSGCSSLTSVRLSDSLKVSSSAYMFQECSSLGSLDLSGLDTSSASEMSCMFSGCDSLSRIAFGEKFSFSGSGDERQQVWLPDRYWLSSADNKLYASSELPSNVAATYTSLASEGWTKVGSCEYRIDEAGGVTLRPLGGADYAELGSLRDFGYNIDNGKSYWTAINPTSFKVEGGVSVTSSDYYGGLYEAFVGCSELQTVDLSGLRTSEPVSCSSLFSGCSSLTSVKLPDGFKASSVHYMFSECSNLVSVDLSGLVTDEPVDVSSLFSDLPALESVTLPSAGFQVSSVSRMFSRCTKLVSVDLSGLVTDDPVDASSMFYGCSALESVKFPDKFKVSSVAEMFGGSNFEASYQGCSSLKSVDLSSLITDSAVDARGLFRGCSSLESVTFPEEFKVSALSGGWSSIDDDGAFVGCSSLKNIDLSNVVTESSVPAAGLFCGCSSLESITWPSAGLKVSRLSNYGRGSGAFQGCTSLVDADLSGLVTDEAVAASALFSGCSSLKTITWPAAGLKVSSLYGYGDGGAFEGCTSLVDADLTGLITESPVDASSLFSGCSQLVSVHMPKTFKVSDADSMFYGCSSLKGLDLSSFDTSSVTHMGDMFSGCSGIAELDLSSFDTSNVTYMGGMFSGCSGLETLDLSGFDTSKVGASDLFGNCYPTTIVLGSKFTFNGNGFSRQISFPNDDDKDIWGASSGLTGKWVSSVDGVAYASNRIPNNVAATYTAQRTLSAESFTVDTSDEIFAGAAITKSVVADGLTEGTDYTVGYSGNIEPGTATVTIKGTGGLGGELTYNFTIYSTDYVLMAGAGAQAVEKTINYEAYVEWKVSDQGVVELADAKADKSQLGPFVAQRCSVNVLPKAEGTTFLCLYANGKQVCKYAIQVVADNRASIVDAQVSGVSASYVYTGGQIKPTVTVSLGGEKLTEGKDYTVSYGKNTDVGEGSVTITGIGDYSGSKSAAFKIEQADISGATATASDQVWNGAAQTPEPNVVWSGRTLAQGSDYTVTYSGNVNAGTATMTVTGKGNFKGTAKGAFTIAAADASGAKVAAAAQAWTGNAIEAPVTVTLGGKTLRQGSDYAVAYSNNVNAGTATATVTFKGNFKGTAKGTFRINAADASRAQVRVSDQAWTGRALMPAPTVTFGGKTLKQGADYTVTYANNTNAGTATVTVTFMGNYTGKATGTFRIAKKDSGQAITRITMTRLYNRWSGEHLYTSSEAEIRQCVKNGWKNEGTAWVAPSWSGTPVYRLYNPFTGDHHYTTSKSEYGECARQGWRQEGVGWYSDDAKGKPLYRGYNPYVSVGTHHYTTDWDEMGAMTKNGWKYEGTAWYGLK